MKKTILIGLVLFLGVCSSVFSQTKSNNLEGIWQYCEEVKKPDGEKVLACSPIWKILYSDGKFVQFMLMYKDGTCAMTHNGTYEVNSENVYTEHITQHAVDKELIGTHTKLNYQFVNDDMVKFSFKLEGRKDEFREIWKRVKLYVPPTK